jgi:hypothetical protein
MAKIALLFAVTLASSAQDSAAREAATARQVARSVDLYTTYMGRWPRTLEDLTRPPEKAGFWPEGGFWLGPLPAGVAWKDGTVSCGAHRVDAAAPTGGPIVPPTDRLRKFFTAQVRLQMARAKVQAYREIHGKLPAKASEAGALPEDPWGKPLSFEALKGRVRLSVPRPDAAIRLDALTPEEVRSLDESGRFRVTEEDARAIRALLGKLSDDDYETRLEAFGKLRSYGPAVGPIVRERLQSEKDPDVRPRLEKVSEEHPDRPPSWRSELRPLSTVVVGDRKPGAETSCANNLSVLWKLECVYMSQFGGRMKKMPDATGKDFWLALAKTTPPLVDATELETFVCPASGDEPKAGVCSYAGPVQNVSRAAEGDAIGLCDDEGHGDSIIVLRKTGDVLVVVRDGPEHEQAKKTTKK